MTDDFKLVDGRKVIKKCDNMQTERRHECISKNSAICSVCGERTESTDFLVKYCANCGHRLIEPVERRKIDNCERSCRRACFYCKHRGGKRGHEKCELDDKEIFWAFDYVCDKFSRDWRLEETYEKMIHGEL